MVEITEQEFQLFVKLKTILRQTSAEKLENVYFFCGEGGTKGGTARDDYSMSLFWIGRFRNVYEDFELLSAWILI